MITTLSSAGLRSSRIASVRRAALPGRWPIVITFDEGSDSAATAARHPVSALTTRTCRCPAGTGWRAASPWPQLDLPQIRLEPLLKARAEELSPRRIRFGHELIALEQDGEGVRATICDNASGRYAVRCQYLLGADGDGEGSGRPDSLDLLAAGGVLAVMVPMGPEQWGPQSEEWVIHLNYPVDDPRPPGPLHRLAVSGRQR